MFTFLCRNTSSTNSASSSFFLWVTNHDCTSSKLSLLLIVVQYKLPWLHECFHLYREILSRNGIYPMLRTNTKPRQLIRQAKISYSIVSLVFHKFSYRTYRNGPNQVLNAEVLQVSQKVRTVLVRYLLLGIRILVYSCTGCDTSKIYLFLEEQVTIFPGEFKIRN